MCGLLSKFAATFQFDSPKQQEDIWTDVELLFFALSSDVPQSVVDDAREPSRAVVVQKISALVPLAFHAVPTIVLTFSRTHRRAYARRSCA